MHKIRAHRILYVGRVRDRVCVITLCIKYALTVFYTDEIMLPLPPHLLL